jgi:small subunit ribosomal protein S6
MNDYEITLVVRPDLEEDARSQLIERVKGWLGQPVAGAAEPTFDYWGLRNLAYALKKYEEGFYVYIEAALAPNKIAELERNFVYSEDILRHLVVRKESGPATTSPEVRDERRDQS